MNKIPVCYCGNKRIFGGIFMSVLSILQKCKEPLEVILLTMDLSEKNPAFLPFTEEQRLLLEDTLKEYNPESSARIIDVTELQHRDFDNARNQKNAYTPYASIRLFLDELDVPEKLIYLDADIMCPGNIKELYEVDVENYEFGAVLDIVGHKFFPKKYCNSGVLLLNLKKIRETGLFPKAKELIKRRALMMPDQSALNMKCKAKLVLPYRFNEQRAIKDDTVIKHFCMGYKWHGILLKRYNYKQWHRKEIHEELGIHQFDEVYRLFDEILAKDNNKELINI